MKAVIHIGAPKTGSSTIQEFLFRNTEALAAQGFRFRRNVEGRGSQYEYPLASLARMGRLLPGEEEQIRYSSTDLAAHKAIGAAVLAELAENCARWAEPAAIFSSEHIFPWLLAVDEIKALDQMFAAHFDDRTYVLYIRNQEDLIVSEYSELLKRGANTRLQTHLNLRLPGLDYEHRVRRWVQAIGRYRFDLRLMEPGFLTDGDLLADFAGVCGFSIQGLEVPQKINESLSAPAAECLRILNDRVPQLLHDGQVNPLRAGFVEQLMGMTPDADPRLGLSPSQQAQVQAAVGASNERLRQEFFPSRPVLFSPASDRPRPAREAVLEQAVDMAGRLVIRLRMGRMPVLTQEQRAIARKRPPGGVSNGIAPLLGPPAETGE